MGLEDILYYDHNIETRQYSNRRSPYLSLSRLARILPPFLNIQRITKKKAKIIIVPSLDGFDKTTLPILKFKLSQIEKAGFSVFYLNQTHGLVSNHEVKLERIFFPTE